MNQCTAPGSISQNKRAGERCVFRRCQELFRRRKNPAGVQSKNIRDTRPGRPNTAVQAASDKLKAPAQPSRTGSTALPWCITPAGCLEENSTPPRSISLWGKPQLIGLVSSSITQKGEHRSPSRQIPSFLIGSDGIQRSHPRHSRPILSLNTHKETVMGIRYPHIRSPWAGAFPCPNGLPYSGRELLRRCSQKSTPAPASAREPPKRSHTSQSASPSRFAMTRFIRNDTGTANTREIAPERHRL